MMHRVLMKPPRGKVVDHINGDGLYNRRANLRLGRHHDNMRNLRISKANRSGFKGVHFCKDSGRWRAQIRTDVGRVSLGCYGTAEEAREAYRQGAIKYHGEFANPDGSHDGAAQCRFGGSGDVPISA
jgi:hypothetical protein